MWPRISIYYSNHTTILADSNVIQRDNYYIDHSQTTRNQDSFNIENTTIARQPIPLDSETFSVPGKFGTSSTRHHDTDTPSGEQDNLSNMPSGSTRGARSAAVPMQCMSEEHLHPLSARPPLSNQDFQSQRAAYSSTNISYVSHNTGMTTRGSAANTLTSQSMYEYIWGKIKEWYDRMFSYLFTRR